MRITDVRRRDLAATAAPFAEARTPPGWWFSDPAVLEHELASIFRGRWLAVAHVSQLAAAGDFVCVDAAGLAVVVIRGEAGELRAFHNSCRHRGTRLLDGCGSTGLSIRCPYHAWAYRLDGALAAVPEADDFTAPADDTLALGAVDVSVWHGFVFVALAPRTTLEQQFDDFPDLGYLNLADLVVAATRQYTVAANWKLLVENYNECYHCASAHPALHKLSRAVGFDDYPHRGREFTGGPMSLEPGVATMADPVARIEPGLPGVRAADQNMVFYFGVYPNLLLTIVPDYVLVHHIWPVAHDLCTVTTHWLISPLQREGGASSVEPAVRFWHRTNLEDFALCENAQRGLSNPAHQPGPYHGWESCVHDFDRWVAVRLSASADSPSPGVNP